MTVIQTVAGGDTGGGDPEIVDLTSYDYSLSASQVSWTASSNTAPLPKFNSSKPYEYALNYLGDGKYAKVFNQNTAISRTLTHRTNITTSAVQSVFNSVGNVKNLPNGDYDLLTCYRGDGGSGIFQIFSDSGNATNPGVIKITVSNGSVTVNSVTGSGYSQGTTQAACRIHIIGVKKTSRSASERSERAG